MMRYLSAIVLLVVLSILSGTASSGIRYNVSSRSLSSIGCVECKDLSSTDSKDLTSCSGAYVFFGLKSSMVDTYDVGAYKEVAAVNAESLFDSPFERDGTLWHFTGGNQGVSGVATLALSDSTSGVGRTSRSNRGRSVGHLGDGEVASSKVALDTDVNIDYREFTFTCPRGISDRNCNMTTI